MTESLDSRHGTSDEYSDPFCDTCYDSKRLTVRVYGFCKDCVQFLCSDCYNVHGKLQGCRHHEVVNGEDMPKSQADKPPRFEYCDAHPKLLKDQFCCEHKNLLCSMCSSSVHKDCSVKTVKDASASVDACETDALYDKIKSLKENLKSALPSVNKDIMKLKDQEQRMLDDAQKIYDQGIAKANKLFADIKAEIRTNCQCQISLVSRYQQKINDIVLKLESPLSDLEDMKSQPVDTKIFLRLQEVVGFVKKFTPELQDSRDSLKFISFSLMPNQLVQEFLASSFTFGTIQSSETNSEADIVVPEISFPLSNYRQTETQAKAENTSDAQYQAGSATKSLLPRSLQPLSNINACNQGTYNVKVKHDKNDCCITGMAITKNRKILMIDNYNSRVKMFSYDMKFLSSVSVPDRPWDIAVISDKEAVVTTVSKSLVILNISGSHLSIKIRPLAYDVQGISRYNNKYVVTSPDGKYASVKLTDQSGKVYWSVSSDQQGRPLFRQPWYVSSHGDGRSFTVIVTDRGSHTLSLLNGDTGEVITRRQLRETYPRGVTSDSAGNVYVTYLRTHEVAVLSEDLSEEKILMSKQDGLSGPPQAIVYDDEAHRLIISNTYPACDVVDFFQLS